VVPLPGDRDRPRHARVRLILGRTQFGRRTYAIGGNIQAAIRAGIPVQRHLIQIYVLAAGLAALPVACIRLVLRAAHTRPVKRNCWIRSQPS